MLLFTQRQQKIQTMKQQELFLTEQDLIQIQFFKTIFQILGSFVVALAGSSLLAYSLGNGGSVVFKEAVYKILFYRTKS